MAERQVIGRRDPRRGDSARAQQAVDDQHGRRHPIGNILRKGREHNYTYAYADKTDHRWQCGHGTGKRLHMKFLSRG
jgi:hypothetical protein